MAEGDRTTLKVAVAGIAATALVGIAGTAGALLSARSDRAAQRDLARDDRRYERRVAIYLDALDLVGAQRTALTKAIAQVSYYIDPDRDFRILRPELPREDFPDIPWDGPESGPIPYPEEAPNRLVSRMQAFGSQEAFTAFKEAQNLSEAVPMCRERNGQPRCCPISAPDTPDNTINVRCAVTLEQDYKFKHSLKDLADAYRGFVGATARFEELVHSDVG